jgi:hypothetical protein
MGKHATSTPDEHEKFLSDIKVLLEEKRPDRIWNISTTSCFRFCPDKRITISVAQQMTMTRAAHAESVVAEILSFKNI